MIVQIQVICYGCIDYNKHHRDDKNFEPKETKFENFSDAFNHKIEYPDHWMTFETYIVNGDEG